MRACLHLIIIGAQLSGKPVGQGWPRVKPRCRSGLTKKFRHFPRIPDVEDQRPYQQAGQRSD